MAPLFDTHAHLHEEAFRGDLEALLERARAAGVTRIVTVGTTLETSRASLALAERHPELWAAVGIHPNYLLEATDDAWEEIRALAAHPRVVAVGETGIDQYWKTTPLELQQQWFQRHIDLAREAELPFIVHLRDADDAVIAGLESAGRAGPLRGVMHSFTGRIDTAQTALRLGLHVSFAGMATFRNNHALREIARGIPADRIVVETDAPYLAPQPHRGKRNEPAHVRLTAAVLAETRGLSPDDFARMTTANALALFPRVV